MSDPDVNTSLSMQKRSTRRRELVTDNRLLSQESVVESRLAAGTSEILGMWVMPIARDYYQQELYTFTIAFIFFSSVFLVRAL